MPISFVKCLSVSTYELGSHWMNCYENLSGKSKFGYKYQALYTKMCVYTADSNIKSPENQSLPANWYSIVRTA